MATEPSATPGTKANKTFTSSSPDSPPKRFKAQDGRPPPRTSGTSKTSVEWRCIRAQELDVTHTQLYPCSGSQSREILRRLEAEVEYLGPEQSAVQIFGKRHPIPRKQAGYGDEGVSYKYSGIRLKAKPWCLVLTEIRDRLERVTGLKYNFVLVNR